MSEIGLTITPNVATTQFVIDQNTIQITPDAIQLSVYTQGAPVAGGSQGQLQYNNLNTLAGASNTNVSNGNVYFQNLPNLKIYGGSNAQFLQTDGTGNLVWAPGTVNANSGNGIPVGANTQIQITDGTGNFVSAPGFTFDNASNLFTAPGNGIISGNLLTGNANLGNVAIANYFIGNFSGNIPNSNYANYAGNITISNQPNITSLGNLTGLLVAGTTTIQQGQEKVLVVGTDANGTINFNALDQAIIFYTGNASNNFTINFRGNSTTTFDNMISNNQSMTFEFINTNGNIGYYANSIKIDNVAQNVLWVINNEPSSGTTNGKDVYTFNIIKTSSNTYSTFASVVGFD